MQKIKILKIKYPICTNYASNIKHISSKNMIYFIISMFILNVVLKYAYPPHKQLLSQCVKIRISMPKH